jgi:hypothetical protein
MRAARRRRYRKISQVKLTTSLTQSSSMMCFGFTAEEMHSLTFAQPDAWATAVLVDELDAGCL